MNEEVMKFYREQGQPAGLVLPAPPSDPGLLRALLRAARLRKEVFPKYPDSELGSLGIVPNITQDINSHWSRLSPAGHLRRQPLASTYFMSTTWTAPALLFLALPFLFIFFVINFPVGLMLYWSTTNLWTVSQGLITRRMVPKPQPPPKRTSRTPPKSQPPPSGGDGGGARRPTAARLRPEPAGAASGVRARREEGPPGPTVSDLEQPDDGVVESEARRSARPSGLPPRARATFSRARQNERALRCALRGRARPARHRPGSRTVMAHVEKVARPSAPGERGARVARGEASRAPGRGLHGARRALPIDVSEATRSSLPRWPVPISAS